MKKTAAVHYIRMQSTTNYPTHHECFLKEILKPLGIFTVDGELRAYFLVDLNTPERPTTILKVGTGQHLNPENTYIGTHIQNLVTHNLVWHYFVELL